ncbi:hypothetical protein ACFPRL_03945 [Pseudoclavibacter helvolus]
MFPPHRNKRQSTMADAAVNSPIRQRFTLLSRSAVVFSACCPLGPSPTGPRLASGSA